MSEDVLHEVCFPAPTPENRRDVGCYYRPDDSTLCWCGHRLDDAGDFGTCPECKAAMLTAAQDRTP